MRICCSSIMRSKWEGGEGSQKLTFAHRGGRRGDGEGINLLMRYLNSPLLFIIYRFSRNDNIKTTTRISKETEKIDSIVENNQNLVQKLDTAMDLSEEPIHQIDKI